MNIELSEDLLKNLNISNNQQPVYTHNNYQQPVYTQNNYQPSYIQQPIQNINSNKIPTYNEYNNYLTSKATEIYNQTNREWTNIVEELNYTLAPGGKRIVGRIERIFYKEKCCVIRDNNTKEIFKCSYNFFFNISPGDSICAYILKGDNNYIFEKYPYVEISKDRETLIKCICSATKKQRSYAEDLLKYWDIARSNIRQDVTITDDLLKTRCLDLDTFISHFSILYAKRKISVDQILMLTKDLSFMKDHEMKKFLFWWYKKRVMRRCYLFTLNNKEINNKNLNMDPIDIYQKIRNNPFHVLSLDIKKCKKICNILGKEIIQDEIMKAKIARLIFSNIDNRSWTGTPNWYLLKLTKELFEEEGINISESERINNYIRPMIHEYDMVSEQNMTYLGISYKVEKYLAQVYSNLVERDLKKKDSVYKPTFSIDLDDKQKEAVTMALNSEVFTIIGPAGSGKTTVIKQIVENIDKIGGKYLAVSYTGKAVARLKEVIGNNSPMTMHMAIYKKDKISDFDYLIIDEGSMIYYMLNYEFFVTFGYNYRIIIVGDPNQLPPIGWGQVFMEILKTNVIPGVKLTKNHRSDVLGENGIIINTNKILEYAKKKETSSPDEIIEDIKFDQYDNFCITQSNNINDLINVVKQLVIAGVDIDDIMVICPYKKDIPVINKMIQNIIDKGAKNIIDDKGIKWMIGDRVLMMNNNYDADVMNGDEGIIIDILEKQDDVSSILIKFKSGKEQDFIVTYKSLDDEEIDESLADSMLEGENYITKRKVCTVESLSHGYAMSIHRAQGSEREFVIEWCPKTKSTKFLNWALSYTGKTRARSAMWEIGDIETIMNGCMTSPGKRYDGLAVKILEQCKTILTKLV